MSQARRVAAALESAQGSVKTAAYAAHLHRHRSQSDSSPQQVSDLFDLLRAMAALYQITKDLAGMVKSCADEVRARYIHGTAPNDAKWPEVVTDAAADADRTLSRLRAHLDKTPAAAGHDALAELRETIRAGRR